MKAKENDIAFTKVKAPFGWLGNLSRYAVMFDGLRWGSTEHLFQAMRFDDEIIREEIREEKGPYQSKQKAKEYLDELNIKMLSEQDVKNMIFCVKLKVTQHPKLRDELLETGDRQIIEDVTRRGDVGSNLFWGSMLVDDEWVGDNVLGNIWMDIRQELKDKSIL